jgi:molecular chaperone DnaK
MIRDAEQHADEARKLKELADARNHAEQLAYQTEKLIKDNEDKLPDDVKSDVQADVDALKSALAGEDADAVKTAFEKLSESQQKLGEAIYANQGGEDAGAEAPADETAEEAPTDDEDIVDAEVVDDEPDDKK